MDRLMTYQAQASLFELPARRSVPYQINGLGRRVAVPDEMRLKLYTQHMTVRMRTEARKAMTQTEEVERSAPDPHEASYRAWSLDTNEEEAAKAFAARYGARPEFIFESMGLLLVGPIPEPAVERKQAEPVLKTGQ